MAIDQELSELTAAVSLLATDIFYLVRDPGGVGEADLKAAVSLLDARFQPLDSDLSAIAALSSADGNFIVGSAGGWVAESGATARASLGVDPAGTDNSTPVTLAGPLDYITLSGQQITRNAIDLTTDITGALPIANGGSGQTSQQAAIDALTNVAAATNEYVLTKDTASGNAIFKAAAAGATLTIQEVDGTPTVANVDTIVVSNGTLTDDGGGQVTIAIGSGSALPVADTTAIVEGSADDTKLLRFEVDGFTTGTTRVLTPPDADITLAGQNFANTFTAAQQFNENVTIDTAGLIINPVDTTNDVAIQVGSEFQIKKVSASGYRILGRGFNTIAAVDADGFGLLTSGNAAQYLAAKGLFLGDAYASAQAAGSAEIRTHTGNPILSIRPGGATSAKFQSYRMSLGFAANWTAVLELDNANHPTEDHLHVTNSTAGDLVCIDENGQLGLREKDPASRLHATEDNAVTNAVTDVVTIGHNSSGTPAAGYGTGLLFQGESSTTEDQAMARLSTLWATATHASRKARSVWSVYDTAEREGIRIEASGTAPMLGVLGAAAIARQAHIADPSGGGTQDAEARTAINAILSVLEGFGYVATS